VSTDARLLRQYAELVKAGHLAEFDLTNLLPSNTKYVEAILSLNEQVGGSIAKSLERMATVIANRDQSSSELELAVAAPKSSARLVLSLPILVFLGAGIAGIPIFHTLAEPSIVWLSLGLGILLFLLGNRWTNRLLAKAQPTKSDPAIELEKLAVLVQAGLPLSAARDYQIQTDIEDLRELSATSGIALLNLVIERADNLRLEQFHSDRMKIQKTSVAVLWPLGLTVLPAFVLTAIVPIGIALIQNHK